MFFKDSSVSGDLHIIGVGRCAVAYLKTMDGDAHFKVFTGMREEIKANVKHWALWQIKRCIASLPTRRLAESHAAMRAAINEAYSEFELGYAREKEEVLGLIKFELEFRKRYGDVTLTQLPGH